jgi:hypothetical protein
MYDEDDAYSLDASIAALAADTGAPASFVAKIRALFEGKGIPLEGQAAPYLGALREAFRREESLRRLSGRSQEMRSAQDLGRLDHDWERSSRSCATCSRRCSSNRAACAPA